MLRRGAQSTAADVTAKTVKSARRGFQIGLGNSVMTVLGNRTLRAVVHQLDLHAKPARLRRVRAYRHPRPGNIAGEPFIPMTIVVFLKPTVRDQIIVAQAGDCEWRG